MQFLRLLVRAIRLRCPLCGKGKLFAGWFSMHEQCANCQYRFEREPGFFLGAIYVNYGLTALVVTIAYPSLTLTNTLSRNAALAVVMTFAILFPIWFFRYARSLWMGFDSLVDRQT